MQTKGIKLKTLENHPLIKVWTTILRDEKTTPEQFRKVLGRVTNPLLFLALSNLKVTTKKVQTPLEITQGYEIKDKIAVAVILRAALGMVTPIQKVLPQATICHVDMYRDEETLKPVWGRIKIPQCCENHIWLVPDPMLATGGSAIATISLLKERGAKKIIFIGVIAAPEGIFALSTAHPDVSIVVGTVDRELTKLPPKGYILPGLGDAGDRQFGTYSD